MHGMYDFYDTVNAPKGALYAINFGEGTTAFFSDGWLQWIRRIAQTEADADRYYGWW
jgi:hypothetical protein